MACYKGWVGVRGEVDGGGGWKVGVRLNSLLGLCGLAMSPISPSHRPEYTHILLHYIYHMFLVLVRHLI